MRLTKSCLLCIDTRVDVTYYYEENEMDEKFADIESVKLGPYDLFPYLGETTLFDLTVQVSEKHAR